jgi:hypothetical protein
LLNQILPATISVVRTILENILCHAARWHYGIATLPESECDEMFFMQLGGLSVQFIKIDYRAVTGLTPAKRGKTWQQFLVPAKD